MGQDCVTFVSQGGTQTDTHKGVNANCEGTSWSQKKKIQAAWPLTSQACVLLKESKFRSGRMMRRHFAFKCVCDLLQRRRQSVSHCGSVIRKKALLFSLYHTHTYYASYQHNNVCIYNIRRRAKKSMKFLLLSFFLFHRKKNPETARLIIIIIFLRKSALRCLITCLHTHTHTHTASKKLCVYVRIWQVKRFIPLSLSPFILNAISQARKKKKKY